MKDKAFVLRKGILLCTLTLGLSGCGIKAADSSAEARSHESGAEVETDAVETEDESAATIDDAAQTEE